MSLNNTTCHEVLKTDTCTNDTTRKVNFDWSLCAIHFLIRVPIRQQQSNTQIRWALDLAFSKYYHRQSDYEIPIFPSNLLSIHPLFSSLDYVRQASMGILNVPFLLPLPPARFYIDSRNSLDRLSLGVLGPKP